MSFDRLLVPLDFSDDSAAALEQAIALAKPLGAALHLLHVYHQPPEMFSRYTIDPAQPRIVDIPSAARERLGQELEKLEAAGVAGDAELREGTPAETIAAVAGEIGAALIVMGTRGASRLTHVLLGSVAERTLRLAPCPVLTVKPAQLEES